MKESHNSLIAFTLTAQAAVGLLIACIGFNAALPAASAATVMRAGVICAAALLLVANIGAALHLANPLRAPFALRNIKTSWLSREVLLAGTLTGGVCLTAAGLFTGTLSDTLLTMLSTAFALIGLAMIYCMCRLYMIPTMIGWNHYLTLIEFYGSMLLLGFLTYLGLVHLINPPVSINTSLVRAAIVLLAGLKLLTIILDILRRMQWSRCPQAPTPTLLFRRNGFIARSALLFAGAGLLCAGYWPPLSVLRPGAFFPIPLAGCLFVLSAEVIGRYLFYHANEKYGL